MRLRGICLHHQRCHTLLGTHFDTALTAPAYPHTYVSRLFSVSRTGHSPYSMSGTMSKMAAFAVSCLAMGVATDSVMGRLFHRCHQHRSQYRPIHSGSEGQTWRGTRPEPTHETKNKRPLDPTKKPTWVGNSARQAFMSPIKVPYSSSRQNRRCG